MLLYVFVVLILVNFGAGAPIPLELVDLSYVQDNDTIHWPSVKKFESVEHNHTTEHGVWYQIEEFYSSTHVGTHMDAPCHFVKDRWSVDEVPVDRLVAEAAVVDIRERASRDRDALVTVEDLLEWERMSGLSLDQKVVLILSGWGSKWLDRVDFIGTADEDENNLHFPGMSVEAAQWLADHRDIYGLGTETLSLDYGPSKEFWAHRILLDKNIYGLENLANVDKLPPFGATLYVMPFKIGGASGAPTRIVALFPKHLRATENPLGGAEEGVTEEAVAEEGVSEK